MKFYTFVFLFFICYKSDFAGCDIDCAICYNNCDLNENINIQTCVDFLNTCLRTERIYRNGTTQVLKYGCIGNPGRFTCNQKDDYQECTTYCNHDRCNELPKSASSTLDETNLNVTELTSSSYTFYSLQTTIFIFAFSFLLSRTLCLIC